MRSAQTHSRRLRTPSSPSPKRVITRPLQGPWDSGVIPEHWPTPLSCALLRDSFRVSCRIKNEMTRIAPAPRRLATAAAVIGVATAGVVWVTTYKTLTPEGRLWLYGSPPALSPEAQSHLVLYAAPAWTIPVAALIGIAAIAAAALVLRRG